MATLMKSDDLPLLVDFLRRFLPSASEVHGAVLNAVEGHVALVTWVDTWPSPKAVVVRRESEKSKSGTYIMFAEDQSALGRVLDEAVQECDWQNSAMFSAIPEAYFQTIDDVANKHGCQLYARDLTWVHMYTYCLDKESLKEISIPWGMSFGQLIQAHAQLVNDTWEFANGDKTLSYIKWAIKDFPNIGLFDKNGDLVAFELVTYYGAMGILFVKPEHRRKGYASSVINALSQKLLSGNRTPFVFLYHENEASIPLHRKLGFIKAERDPVTWVKTKRISCSTSCDKSKIDTSDMDNY